MCDFLLLLGLVLVDLKSLLVQNMLGDIWLDLVMCVESIQVFQSLSKTGEVIIDLELTPKLRQLLQLAEERKILAGILDQTIIS